MGLRSRRREPRLLTDCAWREREATCRHDSVLGLFVSYVAGPGLKNSIYCACKSKASHVCDRLVKTTVGRMTCYITDEGAEPIEVGE